MIPAIWLAVRSVIYSQIKLFFGFKYVRIFTFSRSCHFYSKSHHFRSILQHFYYMNKMRCKSLFCFRFSNQLLDQMNIGTERILRFQNGCYSDKDVFVLRVTQFWSDIRHILVILNLACVAWRFCRSGRRSGVAAKFAREARENERRSREKNKNRLPGFVAFSTAAPFNSFWHSVDNLFGFSFPSQSEIKCWQPKHDTKARDIV